jgi:hypothetical protein
MFEQYRGVKIYKVLIGSELNDEVYNSRNDMIIDFISH